MELIRTLNKLPEKLHGCKKHFGSDDRKKSVIIDIPNEPYNTNKKPISFANSVPVPVLSHSNASSKSSFAISNDILDMLWFKNGPFANYTPKKSTFNLGDTSISIDYQEEPSLIDITKPIDPSGGLLTGAGIGHFPSYAKLTPQQRYTYLNWLTDITKMINIGYVFLFYYGLERHLLFGNMEKAIKIISLLRKHHHNIPFFVYSADASFLAIVKNNRLDLLKYIDFSKSSASIRLFLRASTSRQLAADDIINACHLFGFDDTKYINSQYTLFKSTLEQKLEDAFACKYYPVTSEDINAITSTFAAAISNYSLMPEERFFKLPDLSSSPALRSKIGKILEKTHWQVYATLQQK